MNLLLDVVMGPSSDEIVKGVLVFLVVAIVIIAICVFLIKKGVVATKKKSGETKTEAAAEEVKDTTDNQ